ncbi:hypothetical protein BOTBODRAFT_30591 [Botryobasidium botryosum FD-172 SS1]|uniref:NmrA-like domain-containing protein n=1 Tax=Botryobasidium botryosum (strain FD-172 SS1) TaxID=930990 RepID=A0A067MXQ2_BOTB1|nr:hypothetical protein BOTBODRAFT_30591 [Botryobasidium botryosum FD-172 SS1]
MGKDAVLVLGATGNTGGSIVTGLLDSAEFAVIAAIRPSSASKPAAEALKNRGVEIRLLDLEHASPDDLAGVLKGVDIVISALPWNQLQLQRPVIKASKEAGVKRFIPCDWGTACCRGVMDLHDEKLGIQGYIQEIGLNYTVVSVGWWMQLLLPSATSGTIYGSGDVKTAVTHRSDIGKLTARVIADPRTINKYVFCWAEETTQNEAFALAERTTGKKIDVTRVSEEHLRANPGETGQLNRVVADYWLSLWIREDNVVAKAKTEEYGGVLDAKELYPDLKLASLAEFAAEFYSR